MKKCTSCDVEEAIWAWQPFGPGESPNVFVAPGSYYRGFPVIHLCDTCKMDAQKGLPIEFKHSGKRYIGNSTNVLEVPSYVGDPLAWWIETN